ncbi:conserved hypothetical protein [Caldicellulosiruptor hydrothermalis 108]|uniref:Uncharacterized protein n=1 Tax=Caldicellulosiruptor hydrothermalis (strain DSM 18901 / VKM B-2411 / 108) TaxID=632292 RepID=E4QDR1_CALH1|nr:hypothetical protein [Caldicellulosiruptor hydrothermalis]ADQ06478.1 conserved hypothetical protein [Caldicellulosiruptor hydrothermalis 108]
MTTKPQTQNEIVNQIIEVFRNNQLTFEEAYEVIEELKKALEYLKNKAKI